MRFRYLVFSLVFLSGCISPPKSPAYREFYKHLQTHLPHNTTNTPSDYFLIIYVDARHLDYTHGGTLLNSLAKHPANASKSGDVGHVWIYLKGKNVSIEGGHSGELGLLQPRYFDGIMDLIDNGDADPIRYLWEVQQDGFFQAGPGGHRPTYAVKINLTKEKFLALLRFVNPKHYDYSNYSLTDSQCASFAVKAAEIAGLDLESEITIPIPRRIRMQGKIYTLWNDPTYSHITIATPDILEKSLMHAVKEGKAEFVEVRSMKSEV